MTSFSYYTCSRLGAIEAGLPHPAGQQLTDRRHWWQKNQWQNMLLLAYMHTKESFKAKPTKDLDPGALIDILHL